MPRLASRVDLHSEDYRDNARAMASLVEELKAEVARAARGGSSAAVDKHRAAGKLTARERIRVLLDTGSPFLELSQLAAHGMYGGDIACAGHRDRHRPRRGARVRDRRQRPDRQGRHLLPDHGEEAPARPGDRAREPPAVRVPGGVRRRVPARPGRGVPGPRSLRAHLLQPGDALGARASRRSRSCTARAPPAVPTCRRCRTRTSSCATRGGCSSAARRWSRRRPARTSTPNPSAARTCTAASRACAITTPRTTRTRSRSRGDIVARLKARRRERPAARAGRAALRPGRALRRAAREPAQALRRARGDRTPRGRLRVR